MTAEQKQYSDFVWSLNRDALIEETIRILKLAAYDSDLSAEYRWKRHTCHMEWVRRDGNDDQYNDTLEETVGKG